MSSRIEVNPEVLLGKTADFLEKLGYAACGIQ